jgi:hypothetical protein
MEHLVQHMMYIHLLEQGLLQWEPLVLLIFLLSVAVAVEEWPTTQQVVAVAVACCKPTLPTCLLEL